MNMIDRARFVLFGDLPRRKARGFGTENPLSRLILAALGLGKQPAWTPARYDELSKAGYQNCMTAYACVNQITRAAAGIEWKEFDGEDEKEDATPSVLPLLMRPNENEAKRRFITKHFAYMLLSGNSYIIAGRIGSQPPLALWLARPDRMQILPGSGGQLVGGYRYTLNGREQDFEFGQVMHSKLFHPTHDFYGLSPLEVASHGIDTINMSAEWNMRVLQNDMRPPGALSTDTFLNRDQFNELNQLMKDEWQGYENAAAPLLLSGGLKWIPFAMTAKELDWLNSTKLTKRDICSVFNIDPCLVGDAEFATYSNKQEARKGLYLETVLPLMEEFRDDLNSWLCPMFGPNRRLDIDRDKIEALQEDRAAKYAYIENCSVMRVDEKRVALGLEPVGGKAGKVILVPIGRIPLEMAAEDEPAAGADGEPSGAGSGTDEAGDDVDDGKALAGPMEKILGALPAHKSFWTDPERKKRLWQSFELRVKAREKSFEQVAKSYIRTQAEGLRQRAARLGSLDTLYGTDLFSVKDEAKRYSQAFMAWYVDHFIRAGNAGMRASKGEMFDDAEFKSLLRKEDAPADSWFFHLTSEQEAKLKDMVFKSGTKVNETTLKTINDLINQAHVENWTVSEFSQRIGEKVADFAPWRSRLWAKTESAKVDNWGQTEGYKQTEFVEQKGWLCSKLPTSRPAHVEEDGTEVPLDGTFSVDGEDLEYPGDPKGSAENVCGCLCSVYPVVPEA